MDFSQKATTWPAGLVVMNMVVCIYVGGGRFSLDCSRAVSWCKSTVCTTGSRREACIYGRITCRSRHSTGTNKNCMESKLSSLFAYTFMEHGNLPSLGGVFLPLILCQNTCSSKASGSVWWLKAVGKYAFQGHFSLANYLCLRIWCIA